MKTLNLSSRRYLLAMVDGAEVAHGIYPIYTLLNPTNDCEHAYAIQENIDAVLDLQVGQHLVMNWCRDHTSPCIVKRVS